METYLALRQQLKQSIRAQMQRDNSGGATDYSTGVDSHSNYGCFFGPSETVLTGNAAKQISNLWSKFNTGQIDSKKTAKAKPTVTAASRKRKVQLLKYSRDYSFLDEICTTTTYSPPQKKDLVLKKPIKLIVKIGGTVITKGGERDQKSNPLMTKKESKKSTVSASVTVTVPVSKQQQQQRRPEQKKKTKEGEGQERKSVEKRQREDDYKQPEKKKEEEEKREKVEDEDNYAIKLIREMFGYDPTTFSDDDEEDLKMEASFADIQKEERRSAKIATREDREELIKLEAAECRKKRKLVN